MRFCHLPTAASGSVAATVVEKADIILGDKITSQITFVLRATVLIYQILTKEQGLYASWNRLNWGSSLSSYILKNWTETIKINQIHCIYGNIFEKPVINNSKMLSASPSLTPQSSVPSSCYVFPLLFRHFWFLQAYSPLGNKIRQGELAGTDSMN